MNKWESDKAWSDKFVPAIRKVVGPYLLVPSALEQDRAEATDLVILKAAAMTIACRVRRPGYLNYWKQFTIRRERDSGAKTELAKIVDGFGDWMFYGHSNSREDDFTVWWLLDLAAFRAQLIRNAKNVIHGRKPNNDGTSFEWFEIDSFDPSLVIGKSQPARLPEPIAECRCLASNNLPKESQFHFHFQP